MPKRIRLGTVTSGTLDTLDGTIEIDNGDIYIVAENGDIRTDGNITFEDAAADPSANGELQRNGADLKAFSGGAVRNLSDIGSGLWEAVTGAIRPETADTDVIPNGDSSLGTSSDPWPAVTAGDTHTETIGATNYHYAGDYDGGDADARLDNAISAASTGDRIFLEPEAYTDDRTVSKRLTFEGPSDASRDGASIEGTWTFNTMFGGGIKHVMVDGGTLNLDTQSNFFMFTFNANATINVNANEVRLIGLNGGTVTFDASTSGGILDASTDVSATDNGSNTIGDNA